MDARETGAVLGCVLVFATAGCIGVLTGTQPLAFSANETVVGEDALAETDYREAGDRTINRSFNVSVAGQQRRAEVTSHLHVYNRSVAASEPGGAPADRTANGSAPAGNATGTRDAGAVQPGATVQFAVLATPGATVAGTSLNPLASLSVDELAGRFLDSGGDADLTFVDNRTVRSLGARRTVSTYRAERGGANASTLLVHVATFERDGDVIVAVAGHPASVDERERVDALVAGVERSAD